MLSLCNKNSTILLKKRWCRCSLFARMEVGQPIWSVSRPKAGFTFQPLWVFSSKTGRLCTPTCQLRAAYDLSPDCICGGIAFVILFCCVVCLCCSYPLLGYLWLVGLYSFSCAMKFCFICVKKKHEMFFINCSNTIFDPKWNLILTI